MGGDQKNGLWDIGFILKWLEDSDESVTLRQQSRVAQLLLLTRRSLRLPRVLAPFAGTLKRPLRS